MEGSRKEVEIVCVLCKKDGKRERERINYKTSRELLTCQDVEKMILGPNPRNPNSVFEQTI